MHCLTDAKFNQQEHNPKVSVIIPVYNEEKYIDMCLGSFLNQEFSFESLEALVVDGFSRDSTREIVKKYSEAHNNIRLIDNPKRIQASALNIGFREAKGEIIIRMDAHVTYASDYIQQCVKLLQKTGASNVGPVQKPVGTNYLTKGIALALGSPFGVGDAYYRYTKHDKWVDTINMGTWRKETLQNLGGFAEEWEVNEDFELNYRLRKAGGKILLSPTIRCEYFVRNSLTELARQYFKYGKWKIKTLIAHPNSLRWRQLIPPMFFILILLSSIVLPFNWKIGITVPAMYVITTLLISFSISLKNELKYLPLLPIVFATLHLSWGIGFFSGMRKFGVPRLGIKEVVASFRKVS